MYDNINEYLVLVDNHDNTIGFDEKVKCHINTGKLHRAFMVCVFNNKKELLITKRSKNKMLWPEYWDGTIASHPRRYEDYKTSAKRRLKEEIKMDCKLDYLFKFEYHVKYNNIGIENEICGTLIGTTKNLPEFNECEISEVRWTDKIEIINNLENNNNKYCPWMIIALYLLSTNNNKKYDHIFSEWKDQLTIATLSKTLKHYFPNNEWRIIK